MKTPKPQFGPELLMGVAQFKNIIPYLHHQVRKTRGNGSTACKNETKIKFNGFAVHTIKLRIFTFFKTNHF